MWWFIAIFIGALIVGRAIGVKPQNASATPLSEFDVPTAEVGRPIPVVFGTRVQKGPNIVWYGDFKSEAVKSSGGKK